MDRSRKRRGVGAVLVVAVVAGLVAALLTPLPVRRHRVATATGGKITIAGLGFVADLRGCRHRRGGAFPGRQREQGSQGLHLRLQGARRRQERPEHRGRREARRLVTQEGVLAIVPAVSVVTPSDFLTQQQIPWFGVGYDTTYCPTSGSNGFGISAYGCLIPTNPKRLPGVNWELLKKQLASKGIDEPDARAARHRHDLGQAQRAELGVDRRGRRLQGRVREGCVPGAARGRG